jgi:hypothetical protein
MEITLLARRECVGKKERMGGKKRGGWVGMEEDGRSEEKKTGGVASSCV